MKTNTTISLDAEDIKIAIEEYLNKRGWIIEGNITYDFGTRATGVPYDETEESYFDGANVSVVRKKDINCN